MKNKILVWLAALLVLTLVFALGFLAVIYMPYQDTGGESVDFSIHRGESLASIAKRAEKEQLVFSHRLFKWSTLLLGKNRAFKAGLYRIEGKQSIRDLMDLFQEGRELLITVTIPEGYRMIEIFKILKSKGFVNSGRYLQWATDQAWINSLNLPVKVKTLEGFLFPETYLFPQESSEKLILSKMVATFKEKVPKDFALAAKKVGLTYYQAIILASIVEKETSKGFERPLISAVFHNRLTQGMKLQTDPTVIYGIQNYQGNIHKKDLRTYHPYNTYMIRGLPPTPIASPGLESLNAAVEPKKGEYLFFVARGDGTHEFTRSFKEHTKAVRKYQKRRKRNYRSY